ncbi:SMP-30/gluconolactonase/LRE family protein [Phenylobacterium sp. LjRoot225]|uniref:SMP-30/gluconolactonase/LRE family protein n=1 Tax=Phenylobacterium sp. LjRoot225 TaxID=3342285 RepID=UPI003ED08BF4
MGEGPVWDVAEQALYFLDIGRRIIHRYAPCDGSLQGWEAPSGPGALALREEGGAVVAIKDTIYTLDFESGAFEPLATAQDQPAAATFNDGKVDRQGRFIIGSCSTNLEAPTPIGGIYSLPPGGSLQKIAGDIAFSNSPCFSADGKTLYFSDSARHALYAYEYDTATGAVGGRRLLADVSSLGGMPDGATVDSDGLIWVAIFRGAKVAAFRPDGRLERTIDLPVSLPGSVMFGGADLDQLFVVTIDPAYFNEPTETGAGWLYVVEGLGARGLPEPRFAG